MFIFIMMIGIYRARLATRMSPLAWRLLHATAYLAWLFGLIHGLLGGRPAKPFFGYEGFVYWCYGGCVAAVALALLVRFVAKDRARSHMVEQPVAEAPAGASMATAAAAMAGLGGGAALPGAAMSATALPPARQMALDGPPAPQGQPGRRQLALPAGSSDTPAGAPASTSTRRVMTAAARSTSSRRSTLRARSGSSARTTRPPRCPG